MQKYAKYNSAGNCSNEIRQEMAIFDVSGGSAAVSSQFHIVLYRSICLANLMAVIFFYHVIPSYLLNLTASSPAHTKLFFERNTYYLGTND